MNTDPAESLVGIPAPSTGIDLFLDLSALLTGFSRAELWGTGMAERYYDEVNLIIGEREMGKLLGASSEIIVHGAPATPVAEEGIEANLLDSERHGPIARNIIRLWYLGAWSQLPWEWRNEYGATSYDTDHIVSAEAYQESLVWRAGDTHPMGAKPPGFGSWAVAGPDGTADES